jgi:hypothetical protein
MDDVNGTFGIWTPRKAKSKNIIGKNINQNKFWLMCVSHCGLAIYIKKYFKAKEELWKLKYFTMQKYNLQKIL